MNEMPTGAVRSTRGFGDFELQGETFLEVTSDTLINLVFRNYVGWVVLSCIPFFGHL